MWAIPFAIGGTYVSTSLLFLKYPNLLPNFVKNRPGWYSRKKNSFPVISHISHRGGAGEFYENTLKAFKGAKEIGTQMLELDVHLTKDNVVVVSHDGSLLRYSAVQNELSRSCFMKQKCQLQMGIAQSTRGNNTHIQG